LKKEMKMKISSKANAQDADQQRERGADIVHVEQWRRESRRQSRLMILLALAVVLAPVVCTAIYTTFIAVPMYATEARFAIRGVDDQGAAVNAGGILATGNPAAGQMSGFVDGYAVRDFLQSRNAMNELRKKIDFSAIIAHRCIDFLVCMPKNATDDQLYEAYRAFIRVRYNILEQIVVLDVRAFSSKDAVAIANSLMAVTEEFADRMNQRERTDAFKVAEELETDAEKRDAKARLALAQWRRENADVDPTLDVAMLNTLVGQLESQLAQAESDLATIDKAGIRNTPRRETVLHQVQTLKSQIRNTRTRMAGGNTTLSSQMPSFEVLQSDLAFAESNLTATRQTVENTKHEILRQQKFVAPIAEPSEDGRPAYPDTVSSLAGALAAGIAIAFFGSIAVGMMRTRLIGMQSLGRRT
jgi:capsular polysaccharide transport system permease protein